MSKSFITDSLVKRIVLEEGAPLPSQKINKAGSRLGAYYVNEKEKAEGIVTYGHGQTVSQSEYEKNKAYYDNITDEQAAALLQRSLVKFEKELKAHLEKLNIDADSLPPNKVEVLMDLTYNMGIPRLSKFKKFWAAVQAKDWAKAAQELEEGATPGEKSIYFKNNNKRAKRNIDKLLAPEPKGQ